MERSLLFAIIIALVCATVAFYEESYRMKKAIREYLNQKAKDLVSVKALKQKNKDLSDKLAELQNKKDGTKSEEKNPVLVIRFADHSEYLYSVLWDIGVTLEANQKRALESHLLKHKEIHTAGFVKEGQV